MKNNKKYEFTGKTANVGKHILHRIRALRDFGDVKAGDLGGFIESEGNLSHDGECWVYHNGKVSGNGVVCDNGVVFGHGMVRDHGRVCDHGAVFEHGVVRGHGEVCDHGTVFGYGMVCDHGRVCDNGVVAGYGWVSGHGVVYGYGRLSGHGSVHDKNDIITICSIGSRKNTTTFFKTQEGDIGVACGCFSGTLDEFKDRVRQKHNNNRYAKEYMKAIELAEIHILGGDDEQ